MPFLHPRIRISLKYMAVLQYLPGVGPMPVKKKFRKISALQSGVFRSIGKTLITRKGQYIFSNLFVGETPGHVQNIYAADLEDFRMISTNRIIMARWRETDFMNTTGVKEANIFNRDRYR